MSGQYQERKEYFKQYREKNKERLQQKRHDYYEENKVYYLCGSGCCALECVRGVWKWVWCCGCLPRA